MEVPGWKKGDTDVFVALRTLNRDTVPGKKWKSQGCCIVELA
jgi:hypothetical protein